MAFSLVSGTHKKFPLGNRYMVIATVDDVTSAGSNVTAADLKLTALDSAQAVPVGATVAIQATINSTTGSDTSSGSLFLKSASTTTDAYIIAVGK